MRKKSLNRYHENRDEYIERKRNWYSENNEKALDYQRSYRLEHLVESQVKTKRYQENNKDKIRQYNKKRTSNKRHEISKVEWIKCKQFFNYSCAYCGKSEDQHLREQKQGLHREHFEDEGSNKIDNCIPSCRSCNSMKWKRTFDEWYTENNPVYDKQRHERIIEWLSIFDS